MAKTVNVGLIGHMFMGMTHSNAYLKVDKFFKVKKKPVVKVVCGLEPDVPAFAKLVGHGDDHPLSEPDVHAVYPHHDLTLALVRPKAFPGVAHLDLFDFSAIPGLHLFLDLTHTHGDAMKPGSVAKPLAVARRRRVTGHAQVRA